MFKIVKWILLIIALPIGYACINYLSNINVAQLFNKPFIYIFVISLTLRIIIQIKKPRRIFSLIGFAETLEHELSHASVGLLFLKPPKKLMASDSGDGHVEIESSHSHFKNHAITIAPYIIPLWTVIFLSISTITIEPFSTYISYLSMFTWANFLIRLKHEFHRNQTDLQYIGFIFSFISILLALLIQSSFIINYFYGNGIKEFMMQIMNSYKLIIQLTQNWI